MRRLDEAHAMTHEPRLDDYHASFRSTLSV
jgi:hypothetical protein